MARDSGSNPQIIAAIIAALAAVAAALIANWHSIVGSAPAPAASPATTPTSATPTPPAPAAGAATPPAPAASTPATHPTAPATATGSDFLLPQSATVRLTPADIAGLSAAQLRIARNEIYARHGFIFHAPDLQQHFSAFAWYRPQVSEVALSPVEQANVALLQQAERAAGG